MAEKLRFTSGVGVYDLMTAVTYKVKILILILNILFLLLFFVFCAFQQNTF